jgi:cation diffusion facilitator CzcD-associated flavoprotein CzcO
VTSRTPTVAVIGAGMSGLCVGAKLKQAGIESFTLYEKASELGGTWRENTYPGLACDVPSRFYQFTFAPNPDWSHMLSPGEEIWRYLDSVADRFGLREHIKFDARIVGARWEGERWRLTDEAGCETEADFLIAAAGFLHHPTTPALAGLESFAGEAFHSARWNHEVALQGRRVGVLGTGSSGIQIVCSLAGVPEKLTVFQRTAQWVFPAPNPRYSRLTRWLHRRVPALDRLAYRAHRRGLVIFAGALVHPGFRRRAVSSICRLHLRTVRDRELRRRLTPSYQPMCKRLVVSGGFYRAMQHDGVELVTADIERVEPTGIRTTDGELHELDVLVLATGFDSHAYVRPLELVGQGGITLEEYWSEDPRAYLTVALPGFPNFFMMTGPHSPVGNYSVMATAEAQAGFALSWIERWRAGQFVSVAPTQQATDAFNEALRDAMPGTVWATGCNSWYLDKHGLPELWPWNPDHHRKRLRGELDHDFELQRVAAREPALTEP